MPHVSSPLALIVLMCVCEVLTTLDAFAFASMLPHFRTLWSLSATELGWISGIFFAGYTLAVPVLVSLTDRVDAKPIYIGGAAVIVVAHGAIRQHRGATPAESLVELLDRHRVVVFMGTRLPQIPRPNRPGASTVAHLENAPGWIPVFRNPGSKTKNAKRSVIMSAYVINHGCASSEDCSKLFSSKLFISI